MYLFTKVSSSDDRADAGIIGTTQSTYKVEIVENNMCPIELTKFNPTDLDMSTDSLVKYELILPSFFDRNKNFNAQNSSNIFISKTTNKNTNNKLAQCSNDLYNYLHINSSNGIVTLNKSLDRELCSNYMFYVKATDLIEPRIYSIIIFRISVKDVDDNVAYFEQSSYTFYIADKTSYASAYNLTMNIVDADYNNGNVEFSKSSLLRFKLVNQLEDDSTENVEDYFGAVEAKVDKLNTNVRRQRLVKLIIKKPLNYDVQNRFVFKLYLLNDRDHLENGNEIINYKVNVFTLVLFKLK